MSHPKSATATASEPAPVAHAAAVPIRAATATKKPKAPAKAKAQPPAAVKTAKPASKPATSSASRKAATAKTPSKAARKPLKATASSPVTEPAPRKVKVIRDSFSFPQNEYDAIAQMKKRALTLGLSVKKSELVRAGLRLVANLSDTAFQNCMKSVPPVKTGRPAGKLRGK